MKLSPDQISVAKDYIQVLPELLRDKYGGTGCGGYTAPQIRVAIEAAGLPENHASLAVVLFGDDESAARTGLRTIGRDQITDEIQRSIESETPTFVDRVLDKLIKFLDKAGNISDGTGNDYI